MVEKAENGYEALCKVQKNGKNFYDLIILDINMPIMGGIEALNKIHQFLNE